MEHACSSFSFDMQQDGKEKHKTLSQPISTVGVDRLESYNTNGQFGIDRTKSNQLPNSGWEK